MLKVARISNRETQKSSFDLTREAYARKGVDFSAVTMDKTVRQLTRDEWLKSEEERQAELAAFLEDES